ncbi:MAG: PadR family transcriptional regulator [Clostridia bacterium]|nr:PadR family transcriptional regulator [Clostridia bacterium]MBR3459598.1 PadR family transcriptional regulator [Clostridia bacterium]MBR5713891.1 PadR family transcriptional regulator [Clostridia bacterium]
MDIQLKRGLVEICVLSAMLRGPTYGYQLIKDISPYMEISESTLYPILKRLEASGCVIVRSAEHNGRLRKYYDITPQGRSRIFDFLNDWKDIMKVYYYIEREANHV